MKKFFTLLLLACVCLVSVTACFADSVNYPKIFPEDWKKKELLGSDFREIDSGINYYHYHFKDFRNGEPLSMYMFIIDWKKTKNVKAIVGVSPDKLRRVPDLVAFDTAKTKDKPLFSVNGSYFFFKGPEAYFATKGRGVLYEPPPKKGEYFSGGALAMNGRDFPQIIKPDAESLKKYENLIQGYWLGVDGVNTRAKFDMTDRTPYTVVGTNPEKQFLVIFVNDGRHKKDSPGIAFNEIPDFLFALGCTQVLSIDGGGSSTVALPSKENPDKLEVVNRPSDNKLFDHQGVRGIYNCLYFVKETK